jgi:hypothetical protein
MRFCLTVTIDETTGQLLRLADPESGVSITEYAPGPELAWNDVPLHTRLAGVEEGDSEHVTHLRAELPGAYGAGVVLAIRRVLVVGGRGLHTGRHGQVELYYEVRRMPLLEEGDTLDAVWQPRLDAPAHLETLTVLTAPARWFGPGTHMRALAMGGSGPREHVSVEDGPVAEVTAWLQHRFRTVFPGQQTVNGALYYHPDGEPFVWVVARRPTTGGEIRYAPDGHAYRYYWYMPFPVHAEVITPAITFTWGRGLAEAERRLAGMFDHFEEPPSWWYHTCWFWLHTAWTRNGTFDGMARAAEILMEEGGITGFGLLMHDIPAAGRDIDVGSPRPSPLLGGGEALRRALAGIREQGGHSFAWISRHGHRPDVPAFMPDWAIRGTDGRPIRLRAGAERGVTLDIINPADPSFVAYMKEWIRHYVADLGIDGLFWDSGLQPLYPDFGNKPYLKHPGETLAAGQTFYDDIYRFGRSLSRDFFMWAEGISPDYTLNAFSVDGVERGAFSKNALMQRLAHAGPRRLVWRSHWMHDLASGFVLINPSCDIGWDGEDLEPYRRVAHDPNNRAVVELVREKGVRAAIGAGDGISLLEDYVVVAPHAAPAMHVPAAQCRGSRLRNVVTNATLDGTETDTGLHFAAPVPGVYLWERPTMTGAADLLRHATQVG